MSSFGRGVDFLNKQRQTFGGFGQRGSGYRKLWLRDGDIARFWFLTDINDMPIPLIHLKQMPPSRKTGKPWNKDVLCPKSFVEDDSDCPYCGLIAQDPTRKDFRGPYLRMVGLVYVERIAHKTQMQPEWVAQRSQSGNVLYIETPTEPIHILSEGGVMQNQIVSQATGDALDAGITDKVPTLLGRPFNLERMGEGGATTRILKEVPWNEDIPQEVQDALANVPDIDEIVRKEFEDDAPPARATIVQGTPEYDPTRLPEQGDDTLVRVDFE